MFEVTYRGGNSVVITTKKDELFIDPDQSTHGLKIPNLKKVVQLATEQRFLDEQDTERPALEGPGEYEAGPFEITGFAAPHHVDNDGTIKSTCYRIVIGDITIGVIGNIQPDLSDEQLEVLGVIDILIIPVGGGGYTLDGREAAGLVRKVEPRVVVPVHYRDSGISYEMPQDDVADFIAEVGAPVEKTAKLKIKTANDLPATLTIYQLDRV